MIRLSQSRPRAFSVLAVAPVVAVAAGLGYLGVGPAGQLALRTGVGLACAAVVLAGYAVRRSSVSCGWPLLGAGVFAFAVGDLGSGASTVGPVAPHVHVAYVLGYVCLGLGLAVFLRPAYRGAPTATRLDAALVGLASCGLVWAFVIEPFVGDGGPQFTAGVLYPVLGAIVVSLLGGALLVGVGRPSPAIVAVLVGLGLLLVADLRSAFLLRHRSDAAPWVVVLSIAAWITLAAASLHPSARGVGSHQSHGAWDTARQRHFVVGMAALVGPNVLFAEELAFFDQLLLAGVAWLLAALVVLRMRLLQRARDDGDRRLAAVVQHSSDLVAVIDRDRRVVYASPSLRDTLGVGAGDASERLADAMHPDDVTAFWNLLSMARDAAGDQAVQLRCHVGRDSVGGEWRVLEAVAADRTSDPAVQGVVFTARDVTDHVRAQAALRHEATHDPLTGLANRALIDALIKQALQRAQRAGRHVAVLFLDLDRFKIVNDSFGHGAGDELLVAVARRLEGAMRTADVVGRLGGDEFVVVCDDLERSEDAIAIADHILDALRAPFTVGGSPVFVTASVGVSVGGGSADQLLREADSAMYKAKSEGRARSALFDAVLHARALDAHDTQTGLNRALREGEFVVHYQPIHDLSTDRTVAVEALLRWNDPRRGLVPPGDFLPVAEDTGLIVPIGAWVIDEVCAQLRRWKDAGSDRLVVAVNLSAQQLREPDLVEQIERTLDRHGIAPGELELELTESMLTEDTPHASDVLRRLHQLGLRLGLDDFGTGYSSLARLRGHSFETIKIDRSFVAGCVDDPSDRSIVAAVIALGRSLGMVSVAEGVETEGQLEVLRSLGCDRVQGYLLGRPATASEVVRPSLVA